ncbi:raffinose/stachyose/melibiose transport system permease protein [Microbacterium marinum]|uniref:Raffinose/stachyose/melibiose transport system permease protein n=1 Tax=Microbacterium marinum TaxID=421115 RepID=A0A7W7BSY2_9MICO|nr:sugar ABC transporter permease [Microbacterium marinum]MBB4668249.1 raffinose/stachyose/melibiose transport system permease protein [Microbacterium marinum]
MTAIPRSPAEAQGSSERPARKQNRVFRLNRVPQWFLLPALIFYIVVVLYPSVAGSVLAFTDARTLRGGDWVGFENFVTILQNEAARAALLNTLTIAVTLTIVQTTLGLLLAVALNSAIRGRNLLRTIFFAPMMLPPIITGLLWQYIYTPNGPLDSAMDFLGLGDFKASWLGDANIALWSIIGSVIWHHVGMSMVIYLAGLQGIPDELYEAAAVDGAGPMRRFWSITRPLLGQATTIATVLTMTSSLKLFDQIFVMTGGGPGVSTQTLSLIMYQEAFVYGKQGYGSAIALVLTMIVAAIVFVQMSMTRRGEQEA